ncbi:type II and III secretion system protein family protein [Massilia scottii]|uniref:type II and III secretion system protein family protein n=1 Tax=Massilia scottii TaxID=3057166 RepID=UPI002796AE91|nr:type II and III secretion system protein family protein [Massilia sp. CCM 9029]MDQ1832243.1 type II and III secretion system protein family protein [Massilia sp. CCM 9029]
MKQGKPTRTAAAVFGVVLALSGASAAAAAPKEAQPQAERADSGPRCSGEAARPGNMTLLVGKSNLMRLPEPVRNRSIGNAAVVQAMLVAPDTLYLLGVDVGTTNMIVQGKSGSCSIVDIVVGMDPAALQASLAALMPDEKNIRVHGAADSLVLSGTVADGAAVLRAVELATAFVSRPLRSLAQQGGDAATGGAAAAKGGTGGGGAASTAPAARVINLLAVSAPQQVMLEVKIAEVSKSLLERLEGGVTWGFGSGSWATTLLANFITGNAQGALGSQRRSGNRVNLEAQKQDGIVRILAEPNVMAVSGQEGSFLAGGSIFIPVAQDNNKVTLEEKEFGVGLRFTPTVLAGGRINLKVAPEVSEVSREGIGVSAAGFTGGAVLPLITKRRASTTLQLFDGQSFAIGGLIKNNLITNRKGLPLLGEVPVLGALFRSTDFQEDRTELVFVVTAHLVKPLPANYTLPTDSLAPPSRTQMMLGSRLEGEQAAPRTAGAAAPAPGATPGTPASSAQRGFELK